MSETKQIMNTEDKPKQKGRYMFQLVREPFLVFSKKVLNMIPKDHTAIYPFAYCSKHDDLAVGIITKAEEMIASDPETWEKYEISLVKEFRPNPLADKKINLGNNNTDNKIHIMKAYGAHRIINNTSEFCIILIEEDSLLDKQHKENTDGNDMVITGITFQISPNEITRQTWYDEGLMNA